MLRVASAPLRQHYTMAAVTALQSFKTPVSTAIELDDDFALLIC